MSKQVNQRDAEHYITNRQEFTASALSGKMEEFTPQFGRLDNEEVTRLIDAFNLDTRAYVVYSYGTPIALHNAGGWHLVGQKFSMTTSKHQNLVRRAANLLVV